MTHVLGVGGVFFRSRDPKALLQWYQRHFGLTPEGGSNSFRFEWAPALTRSPQAGTVLSPFPQDTTYFGRPDAQFMLNLLVHDLDGLVAKLKAGGVELAKPVEHTEWGNFAWVKDPEGRTIELWEAPPSA